ncbi:MAG: serine/threonine protein kinase/formylglycine-generating enzyme required for sulfatase activity [Myxococcota bacterium]|jgi:serine/threonine protein kinase/formylglycine-generating enzyme required for sulfatase activity
MNNDRNVRGQLLRIADLYGLGPDCLEDLMELLEEPQKRETWMKTEPSLALWDEPVPRLDAPPVPEVLPGSRYEVLDELGVGGMGEVHRVFDRQLNRSMARKVLKRSLLSSNQARARFLAEARITAQLQHPGIVPIHDVGELLGGQPFYTMREIRGQTLKEAIRAVHRVSSAEAWGEARAGGDGEQPPWSLRRLVSALRRACEAIAYAHSRGVIHRDIKPDNIMVGAFGEVLVMDWGIARLLDQRAPRFAATPIVGVEAFDAGVVGTPAYMPFEQADGSRLVGPRADTYALGATLYHILTGKTPYSGDVHEIRRKLLAGPPAHPRERAGPPIPAELEDACLAAMAREPEDRLRSPLALAEAITNWLEGARRRDVALKIVARADGMRPELGRLRGRVRELRAEADKLLADVRPHASEAHKQPGWSKQDEAAALEREASLKELEYRETLRTALHYVQDLPEARDRLADYYAARHTEAERSRHPHDAEIQGRLLQAHDRGRYATYLRGEGALTLYTDPPGARVRLYRYEPRQRRQVPVYLRSLGYTPIISLTLPIGSYLLKIQHPDRQEVRYPLLIERQEHWDGVPPGGLQPHPVYLPRRRELRSDDCYVPAGWFWSGGDPDAGLSLPRRRLWCDGAIVKRFPVTNAEYMAFLDDLVASGQEPLARRYAPRERPTPDAPDGALLYGRSSLGRFLLVPDATGDVWLQDMPVIMMPWAGAVAYTRWKAAREGLPWRLPGELEWEKAARGVDGRLYPWGDRFDPSWCCTRASHPGRPQPVSVDSFPIDESPYGVRGMAGNTRDWCGDLYSPRGPRLEADRVVPPQLPTRTEHSAGHTGITRGGAWWYSPREARVTYRTIYLPQIRFHPLSFRLASSFPTSDTDR